MRVATLALLAAVATLGCIVRTGPQATTEIASRPGGSPIMIFAAGGTVDGELLEVSDTAFVVLTPTDVVIAPLAVADSARFLDRGRLIMQYGPLTPERRETLRLISRYPPGMPEPAVRSLLRARNKSAARVLTR